MTVKVQLKQPDVEACLLMDFRRHHSPANTATTATTSSIDGGRELVSSTPTSDPTSISMSDPSVPSYFGRKLTDWSSMKETIKKFDLKTRNYIGPTSLDHSLAFIMSNISKVDRRSVVFDPFVGTGSILLALAKDRALCFGGTA